MMYKQTQGTAKRIWKQPDDYMLIKQWKVNLEKEIHFQKLIMEQL